MYLKIHEGPNGEVVAVCDAELLGRVIADGRHRLDLEKFGSFYAGKKVGKQEAVAALRGAKNANLVGKKSLEAAAEAGLDTSGAIDIGGVPHLQAYRL